MTNEVITPAEAWEEVERRKIDVSYYRARGYWYASDPNGAYSVAAGATPLEAVAKVLGRIAEDTNKRIMARVDAVLDKMEAAGQGTIGG